MRSPHCRNTSLHEVRISRDLVGSEAGHTHLTLCSPYQWILQNLSLPPPWFEGLELGGRHETVKEWEIEIMAWWSSDQQANPMKDLGNLHLLSLGLSMQLKRSPRTMSRWKQTRDTILMWENLIFN